MKIALAFGGFLALVFFMPMLGTIMGMICGAIVGLLFDDTFRHVLRALGSPVNDLAVWQFGAFLGFVGGFLKTNPSSSKS